MDFNLTEERRMLQDMMQRLLADKYSHEARRKLIASGAAYNIDLFAEMAELGVLGALFCEAQGGFGGTGFDISVVFEELGRTGMIEPILGSAVLAGQLISALGNDAQKLLIGDIINGTTILGFAHSEAGARYDLNHVVTRANEKDDVIVLNGLKTHVINGAQAKNLVVSAREYKDIRDEDGISLFIVPLSTKGVTCTDHTNIDGTAGATISLENVSLDKTARLGSPGEGFTAIETAIAHGTLAVCAEAIGAMEAAKKLTISYLKERHQFGVPLGQFQVLQHRMADMLIEIEQARSAVVNLAGNLKQPRQIRERHVSATKNLVGRVGTLVAEESIQMHGGIGMTDEYALSHFARRLVMIDHQFGDIDHHLERFITLNAA